LVSAILALAAGQAAAQDYTSAPPPPIHSSYDANGVDLISGAVKLSGGGVSIGDPQSGGLSFSHIDTNPAQSGAPFGTINYDGGTALVSIGERSERFTPLGNCAFASAQGLNSTLKCSNETGDTLYTYTAADGTVAIFSYATRSMVPRTANNGNIISLVKPSGEKLTFTYKWATFCDTTFPAVAS